MGKKSGYPISISKNDLLESFVQLYHAIKDYDELLELVSDDQKYSPQKIKEIVQLRMSHLEFGSVNVKAMELIGAFLRFALEKFKGEKIKFLIPNEPDDDFFAINDGFLALSDRIETIEKELREIEEKVFFICQLLPPKNVEKIGLLLKAISSFFKSIIRKDVTDMGSHINHIHHLTASKESYFVINDIGRMVREIHNSLREFSDHVPVEDLDASLVDDMPDAIDKLNLVIKRMEDSANSTLDVAEVLLDRNAKEKERVLKLTDFWAQTKSELSEIQKTYPDVDEKIAGIISNLDDQILEELESRAQELSEEETTYFDIISNQSFQDITGQTLKKIITFIEQLEFSLLNILQKYGGKPVDAKEKEALAAISPLVGIKTEDGLVLEGPQDNQPKKETAKQADVDKMLAEFGF
ncbi:MAG: protein phosphatase CheZ [bacterium]